MVRRFGAIRHAPLNPNDWNFVLVPTMESQYGKGNNLSVTGLNHALRFGQVLSTLLAGKQAQVRQVYAFTYEDAASLAPLETIQPYAVLNNLAVNAHQLQRGDASVYDSPAYFVQQILANQARGTYIMAMPENMLQDMAVSLTGSPVNLAAHDYAVVSGRIPPLSHSVYDDGIPAIAKYPDIPLPPRAGCPQPAVTLHAKAPQGWRPYTAQTVYFVRHVEAHPNGTFENGNYVCQGQWRALGANARLLEKMKGRIPDTIFTSDPTNIIGCDATCSYVRPSLTVAPFAIEHGMPLTVAPFQWQDAAVLAQSLFNRAAPYFEHADGAAILVGWEHAHIEKAVKYLVGTMYADPKTASMIPAWSFEDYDTIWAVTTDEAGNLTFRNDCEGIPTSALPSTCPAFFQ